jgi:hypothetical protein
LRRPQEKYSGELPVWMQNMMECVTSHIAWE